MITTNIVTPSPTSVRLNITDDEVKRLAAAFKRWVDAGKPDYIPREKEEPK